MASGSSESGDSLDTHKQQNNRQQDHGDGNGESTGDEYSDHHNFKNEPWNQVNGYTTPTGGKAEDDDAYGASADTREEKPPEINARQPSSDTGGEAERQQTASKEEAKPVKEALVETEKGVRRRRRRRNQPAWYDVDNEKTGEKQLAETRPQELQQQLEQHRQQQQLDFQQQQQQLEFQRRQMEVQLREQQLQAQQNRRNNSLKLRLDLNLDVEVTLKAKIHGDLTLSLL